MPQVRLILDVAILAVAAAALAWAFNAALTARFIPWVLSVSLFGVAALAVWLLLELTPVKYTVEEGVVKLCSPVKCVEYVVEGVEEGVVYNPRMWREWFLCSGFRGFKMAWAWCPNGHLYFATARCRDTWKKLQVRKGNERYTLWLCIDNRG